MFNPAQRMREAGFKVNPPATEEDLHQIEETWQVELPTEIRQLYFDHNGQPEVMEPHLPFRLMMVDEVVDYFDYVGEDDGFVQDMPEVLGSFVPLWADDNGNYAVYFLTGARAGMIGEADHESPWSIAPQWLSLESFYDALLSADQENYKYRTEFPNLGESLPSQRAAYAEAKAAFEQAKTPYQLDYWGANMLSLCPVDRTVDLIALLKRIEHEYTLGHAIPAARRLTEQLGEEAVPYVIQELKNGQARDMTTSSNFLQLIREFKSESTAAALWELAHHSEAPYMAFYLVEALEKHGFKRELLKDEEGKFRSFLLTSPTGETFELSQVWYK